MKIPQDKAQYMDRTARKLAWRYGDGDDELYAVARHAMLAKLHSYRSARGRFTTWSWHVGANAVFNEISQYRKRYLPSGVLPDTAIVTYNHPAAATLLAERIGELSADARFIIRLVIEAPISMIEALGPQSIRSWLRKRLMKKEGWQLKQVRKAMRELREEFGS